MSVTLVNTTFARSAGHPPRLPLSTKITPVPVPTLFTISRGTAAVLMPPTLVQRFFPLLLLKWNTSSDLLLAPCGVVGMYSARNAAR
jgi:hypothetical protein